MPDQTIIDTLLERLSEGKSVREICSDPDMPNAATIWRWSKGDDDLASAIVRAREVGYHLRAEAAVANAKTAVDASLGRLAFDAERWHLSKLCKAFADKVVNEHTGAGGGPISLTLEFVRPDAPATS